MIYAKREADVKNNRILYVEAPFDQALVAIESKGGKIITAKQLADARMQYDSNHTLSTNGSYVKEGNLFVPKGDHRRILLRNSLVLKNPTDATESHRKGNEYLVSGIVTDFVNFIGKLKEGTDYIFLDSLKPVPTDRFGEDKRINFLFGKSAQNYGLWLKEQGNVSETGFYNFRDDSHIDKQEGLFAGQLWLHGLGGNSDIYSNGGYLYDFNGVRGVSRIGEAGAPEKKVNVVDTYTPKEMKTLFTKSLNSAGITGKSQRLVISDLEKRLK